MDVEDDAPPPRWTAPPPAPPHTAEEEELEEGECDGGPPPGWQAPPSPSTHINMEPQDMEDEEGPPPGWDSVHLSQSQGQELPSTPQTPQAAFQSDVELDNEQPDLTYVCSQSIVKIEDKQLIVEDEEGPPPGWVSDTPQPPQSQGQKPTPDISSASGPPDVKYENEEPNDEEGLLPGCGSATPQPPQLQLMQPVDLKMENRHPDMTTASGEPDGNSENEKTSSEDEEGPPPGWGSATPQPSQSQLQQPTPEPAPRIRKETEKPGVGDFGERQPLKRDPVPSAQSQTLAPKPSSSTNTPEMGQLVCGSCRQLLSYPRGAKYVKCASCQTVNFVLEEDQVGQVKCGNCTLLLMYPYGAPKVCCSSCRYVTEIGEHNRRPPWSVQQSRARNRLKRVC